MPSTQPKCKQLPYTITERRNTGIWFKDMKLYTAMLFNKAKR